MNELYRKYIIESIDKLFIIREELFTQALNLSMQSNLKEIDEVFELDQIFKFELAHLDNSGDINIQKIVDLIKEVESTTEFLININKIDPNKLSIP